MPEATLPPKVARYSQSPLFEAHSVPEKLTKEHSTKAGVWGIIRVSKGTLRYVVPGEGGFSRLLDPEIQGVIAPQQVHFVELLGPVAFRVEFYR